MRAWWFAPDDGKLRYGDDRRPRKGHTHYVAKDRPVKLCHYGLHASVRAIDALSHAPGSQAWRVELGKSAPGYDPVIILGGDKAVAYERTYIAKVPNCEALLRKFARMCASDVLGEWDGEPPDVVTRWLRTGDESIRSASYSAADSAAHTAAYKEAYMAAVEKQNRRLHRMMMDAIRKGR